MNLFRIFLKLLSLAVCIYSRPNTHHSWKPGRRHRNWLWESKRNHLNQFKSGSECCPSVPEIIQPKGGISKEGRILEVYRDEKPQSFHQISCLNEGMRCRYVSEKLQPYSKCIQRYSYTYALVREYNSTVPWRLDYIRVNSGCSCIVNVNQYRADIKQFLIDRSL